MQSLNEIKAENERRWKKLKEPYDPIRGIGSPLERFAFKLSEGTEIFLPNSMKEVQEIQFVMESGTLEKAAIRLETTYDEALKQIIRFRCGHDYEFWAATCVSIEIKVTNRRKTGGYGSFILNRPQRKLLLALETMRLAGVSIRLILLKARQWGGSTLVQLYIAWIQLFHRKNWHALVVADVKQKAQRIRGMYQVMANNHPANVIEGMERVILAPYQQTQNFKVLAGRDCILGVTSVETPHDSRSFTIHMVHASEVGFWKSTPEINADNLISALEGGIVDAPYSLLVKESTALGVGNYFHRAWQAAEKGESRDTPLFVSWFEDPDDYNNEIGDIDWFIGSMNTYEKFLWELGATLEHILWYRIKRKGYASNYRMQAEYPSTPDEAFQSTGSRIFEAPYVQNARKTCKPPVGIGEIMGDAQKGEKALKNLRFVENENGGLKVWRFPSTIIKGITKPGMLYKNRFCSFLDTGGKNPKSDYWSLTVLDRVMTMVGGVPEVCAHLHIHMDADLAAWYAVRVCKWYDNAYFAVEMNKLYQGDNTRGYESDSSMTVIDEIKEYYDNIYYRVRPETIQEKWNGVIGFHTNQTTKPLLINALNAGLRDGEYEERELEACDEFDKYEDKGDGTMGAIEGSHDDIVISRGGALWLSGTMPPVVEINPVTVKASVTHQGGFAQF